MITQKALASLKRYEHAKDVPLTVDEYKKAADLGLTFWQYLELVNPTKAGDSLNAFERQLQASGIVTKSDPDRGLFASSGEYFFQSDRPGSAILFPVLLQKTALWAKLKRFADINKLVASTRTISGNSAYQALSIDDSELTGPNGVGKRFRVDQKGNFPAVSIGWSEKTNAVTKHGVQLDWSYEFIRRASIELITTVVSRITLQDQLNVLQDAVDLAINGDGGPNAACVVKTFCTSAVSPTANEIQLDAASGAAGAGVLPYEGYLKFIGGMSPYTPNVICGSLNTLVKLITMARPNMDPAEIITRLTEAGKTEGKINGTETIFPNVDFVRIDTMPENKILQLDTEFALERVIELGSDLQEIEKAIKNQTESMVLSIADNTSKLFNDAIQLLDFSAAARNA